MFKLLADCVRCLMSINQNNKVGNRGQQLKKTEIFFDKNEDSSTKDNCNGTYKVNLDCLHTLIT
jgi:hypothetical protein